jgi:hypothetical protein
MVIEGAKTDINFLRDHTLQPKWWKILKVFVLLGIISAVYLIFGYVKTIIWFSIFVGLSLIMHLTYRIKTQTYTRTWMDFKVEEVDGKLVYGRIGSMYYTLVVLIFLIATITVVLL